MLQSSLFVSSEDPLISQESCHMFVRNSFRVGFSLKPYTLFQGRSQTKREEVRETMKRTHRVLVLLVITALMAVVVVMAGAATSAFGQEAKAGKAEAKAGFAKAGKAEAKAGE
jgi:Mn2+/Fe2+ NRAMP family transporter